MSDTYTVSQLAERLSVSTSTIRRFSEDFAELLPDYEHVPGRVRSFSEADVRHLCALFTEMDSRPHGASRADLLEEIKAGDYQLAIPTVLPHTKNEGPADQSAQPAERPRTTVSNKQPGPERLLRSVNHRAGAAGRTDSLQKRRQALDTSRTPTDPAPDDLAREVSSLRQQVRRSWLYVILSAAASTLVVLGIVVLALKLGWLKWEPPAARKWR